MEVLQVNAHFGSGNVEIHGDVGGEFGLKRGRSSDIERENERGVAGDLETISCHFQVGKEGAEGIGELSMVVGSVMRGTRRTKKRRRVADDRIGFFYGESCCEDLFQHHWFAKHEFVQHLVEMRLFQLHCQLGNIVTIPSHDSFYGLQFRRRHRKLDGRATFLVLAPIWNQGSVIFEKIGADLKSFSHVRKLGDDDGGDIPVYFRVGVLLLEGP